MIDRCFPLEKYRVGQKEAIERIVHYFNEKVKFVLLEAPTGSGKSVIGFTVAQLFSPAYYLAPQKFLQDQLSFDFGENGRYVGGHRPMIELKGRVNYRCDYYKHVCNDGFSSGVDVDRFRALSEKVVTCDVGECKKHDKSKLDYCLGDNGFVCEYFRQLEKALSSSICLMNFHSFLFQSSVVHRFLPRKLLILDEGHVSEDVLMKFVELRISDRPFVSLGIRFPELSSVEDYLKFFEDIKLRDLIVNEHRIARLKGDSVVEDEWERLLVKYSIVVNSDPSRWVHEFVGKPYNNVVTLKPLFVDDFANSHLFSMADHVLIMSATLLSKKIICDSLGMSSDEVKFLKMGNTFPVENRPVISVPCGSLSFKNKAESFPKLISSVNLICSKFPSSRGIVHTHNFEIANLLMDNCSSLVKRRFLFQKDVEFNDNKFMVIEKHKLTLNSIIIAPAMHEGLSLDDDLARFQIVCKVPYPSLGDVQVKMRMDCDHDWLTWKTALKLIQSIGRAIRHDEDWAVTFVLDADFLRFVQNSQPLLPKWFSSSIMKVEELEEAFVISDELIKRVNGDAR